MNWMEINLSLLNSALQTLYSDPDPQVSVDRVKLKLHRV